MVTEDGVVVEFDRITGTIRTNSEVTVDFNITNIVGASLHRGDAVTVTYSQIGQDAVITASSVSKKT